MTMTHQNSLRLPLDKFLERIRQLPAVQHMVQEEIEKSNTDSIAARSDCLAKLRHVEKIASVAIEEKDQAVAQYNAALAKLEPLRQQMIAAEFAAGEAQRQIQGPSRELHTLHGEHHVTLALAVLQSLHHQTSLQRDKQLDALDGAYGLEIKTMLDVTESQLSVISAALKAAKDLVRLDLVSPNDLKTRTEALLKSVGYKPLTDSTDVFSS